VTRLAKIALCLWLVTQPGCHWILGALGAKAAEEDKAEDWHMRTIRLQIAATETHCGCRDNDCRYSTEVGGNCHLFGKARQRHNAGYWFCFDRLPECIAAEEVGK